MKLNTVPPHHSLAPGSSLSLDGPYCLPCVTRAHLLSPSSAFTSSRTPGQARRSTPAIARARSSRTLRLLIYSTLSRRVYRTLTHTHRRAHTHARRSSRAHAIVIFHRRRLTVQSSARLSSLIRFFYYDENGKE